jgi:hypothetical protein
MEMIRQLHDSIGFIPSRDRMFIVAADLLTRDQSQLIGWFTFADTSFEDIAPKCFQCGSYGTLTEDINCSLLP